MQRTRGKNGAERQTGQAVASTEAVRGKQNVRPRNPAYRAPVPRRTARPALRRESVVAGAWRCWRTGVRVPRATR